MSENKKTERSAISKKELLKRLASIPPMGASIPMGSPELRASVEANREAQANAALQGFTRQASNGLNTGAGGAPGVQRAPLMYVDPMFDPILFLFPKDRIDEINKRLRHYYETDPIVGGAIDMHVAFPLSDFYLECEDPENQKYWNDWKDRVGLLETMRCLVHDYWLLGEGVVLPVWDPYNFEFSHFNQYPPENVDIASTYVTPKKFFMLKPDPKLVEKVNSANEADKAMLQMMDTEYVKSLQEGRPFFLGSDDKVMYLARLTTKYRSRGISLLSRALKDLLYKDKLRLLQLTFVDRHMFPLKIFKVGSESRGWIPSKSHFERLQAMLAQAANDPDFSLIWHFGLQVDYVGTKDKIMNLVPEFEWVEKQVMAAMFVNDEIIHGGIPSAVRDTVNMRTLMARYMDVREKIERMMVTHVFLPMARARGFYRKTALEQAKTDSRIMKVAGQDLRIEGTNVPGGDMFRIANSRSGNLDLSAYDIPRPIWKKVNLVNNAAEQQLLMNLEGDGKVPLEMVLDMMGLDPKVVARKLKEQESTPFDPLYRQIRDELGKLEGVREQILGGSKVEEWTKPDEGLEETAPGAMSPSFKKKPPMGGGAGGGSSPEKKDNKTKGPLDMGGGPGPAPAPKAPLDVKTPPAAAPGMSPMTPAMGLPPAPTAPGGEKAPGMGGATPPPAPGA